MGSYLRSVRRLQPPVRRFLPLAGRSLPSVRRLRPVVGRLLPIIRRLRPCTRRLRPATRRVRPISRRPSAVIRSFLWLQSQATEVASHPKLKEKGDKPHPKGGPPQTEPLFGPVFPIGPLLPHWKAGWEESNALHEEAASFCRKLTSRRPGMPRSTLLDLSLQPLIYRPHTLLRSSTGVAALMLAVNLSIAPKFSWSLGRMSWIL